MKKLHLPVLLLVLMFIGTKGIRSQTDSLYTQIPYNENFNTWTSSENIPRHWSVLNQKETGNTWVFANSYGGFFNKSTLARSGNAAAIASNPVQQLNDWLISPLFELRAKEKPQIKFYYGGACDFKSSVESCAPAKFEVRLSPEGGGNVADFTIKLGEITVEQKFSSGYYSSQRTYDYTELSYLLEQYGGTDKKNVRIAFHAISEPGSCGILIDDFSLTSSVLSPPPPITFTDVYQSTFTANWPASSLADCDLVFSTTRLSDPKTGGNIRLTELTEASKTFDGLTPGTNYYVYIRYMTGSVVGEWGEGIVKTGCTSYNNYENDTLFKVNFSNLVCWEMRDYLNEEVSWSIDDFKKQIIYKNSVDNDNNGTDLVSDDWLFSPMFKLSESIPYSLEIKLNAGVASYAGGGLPEVFSIWFVENMEQPKNPSTSTLLVPSKNYIGNVLIQLSLEQLMGLEGRIAIQDETSGRGGKLEVISFSVSKSPDCIPVDNLVLENRTLTAAKLKWKSNGSSFIVKIKKGSDFNPILNEIGTDISTDVVRMLVNTPEIQFIGLEQGTQYWVYVSNNCTSDSSTWTKLIFRTKLIIDKFPWVDRFETFPRLENINYDIETNWTILNGNKDKAGSFVGLVVPNIAGYGYSAGNTGSMDNKKDNQRNQWLVTPPIKVPLSEAFVSFEISNGAYSQDYPDIYAVWVSRRGNAEIDTNQSNWEVLIPSTYFTTNTKFEPVTYDLTEYKGETIYLAIRSLSERYDGRIVIDNFKLDTVKPSIDLPKNFDVVSTTSNTATIQWESTAPEFDIRYQQFLFNPNEEGVYYEYPSTDQKQITLANLGSGRLYYVFIRSNYNGTAQPGVSPWMGPFIVNMVCDEQILPFVETFDSWLSYDPSDLSSKKNPIGCWKLIDQNFPEEPVANGHISVTNTAPESVFSPGFVGKGISLSLEWEKDEKSIFLITPPIQFPTSGAIVSFWGSGTHGETKYNIRLTTKGNSLQDCQEAAIYIENEIIPYERAVGQASFVQKVHLLSDKNGLLFPGETVYVIIEVLPRSDESQEYFNGFKMDDFMVEENISECSIPTKLEKSISKPNTLTWESTANSFEVVYESRYFNPVLSPEIGTKITIPKTGKGGEFDYSILDAGKKYHLWVRGICAGGKTTKWVNDTIFPSCGNPILVTKNRPFSYHFDGWQLDEGPNNQVCWKSVAEKTGPGFIGMVGGVTTSRNVGVPAYDTSETWLISPLFDLKDSAIVKFKVSAGGSNSVASMEKFDVMAAIDGEGWEVVAKDVFANNNKELPPYYVFDLYKYKGEIIKIAIVRTTINKEYNVLTQPFKVSDFNIIYPECSFATNVVIPNTPNAGADGFKVTWDGMAGVTTTQWEIKYSRDEYFNPEYDREGVSKDISAQKEYTFSIPERTRVIFYIRPADGCDASALTRNWTGPFAAEHIEGIASISTYPFLEDFENWGYTMNDFRAGWTAIDVEGNFCEYNASTKFNKNFDGILKPNKSGNNSALMVFNVDEFDVTWNSWLISPAFDFDNTLGTTKYAMEFWIYDDLPDKPEISIYLADSKDLSQLNKPERLIKDLKIKTGQWIKVQVFLQDSIDAWRSSGMDLRNMYIGIWDHSDPSYNHSISMDDFRVFDFGTCAPVSDLVHEKIEGDSVKFTFTYKNTNPDDVKVYYKVGMFDNEQLPEGVEIKDATVGNGGDWFIELKNLKYCAEYAYYIQTTCGSDVFWSGPFQFKSDCDILYRLPIIEDFKNWNYYEKTGDWGCWNVIDGNVDGATFASGINDSYPDGSGSARFFPVGFDFDTVDEWLISPPFIVPAKPEIKASYLTGSLQEDFVFLLAKRSDVKKENGEFDLTQFKDTLKKFEKINTDYDWETETFNTGNSTVLEQFVDDTVYFALHMYSGKNEREFNKLAFDYFIVTSEHACFNTPTDLLVTGIDIETAKFTWSGAAHQASWDVDYWKVGAGPLDTNTTIRGVFSNSVQLTGLIQKSNYEVRVRSNCTGDPDMTVGPWSGVYTFKTLPSCQELLGLKIDLFRDKLDEVKLSWLATAFTPNEFEVQFKKSSDPNSTFNNPANQKKIQGNQTSVVIENLLEDVIYNFRIRKICSAIDTSDWATARIKTYYPCISSTVLEKGTIDKWWAVVKWNRANAGKTFPDPKYTVVYHEEGSTNWITTPEQTSIDSIKLTGLKAATNYEWYVLSECDLGNIVYSNTVSFRTKDLDRFRIEAVPNNTTYGRIEGNEITEFDEGTIISLTAIPVEGYVFINWTTADGKFLHADPTYTLTLTDDVSIRANFLEICYAPDVETLEVTSLKSDSTVIAWAPATHAVHYIFEYKLADAITEWEPINDITDTKITLTTLEPWTYYLWRLRSYCSPGNESDPTPEMFLITSGSTGISHVDASKGTIMLIPNPAKIGHKVQVQIEGLEGNVSCSLIDLTGRVVLKKPAQPIANIEIDLAGIKQGVYFVKLTGEGWTRVEKLVVVQ